MRSLPERLQHPRQTHVHERPMIRPRSEVPLLGLGHRLRRIKDDPLHLLPIDAALGNRFTRRHLMLDRIRREGHHLLPRRETSAPLRIQGVQIGIACF